MPSGFFTQSAVVLFESAPSIDAVTRALGSFAIARQLEAAGPHDWMGGYPGVLVAMRPEVNGYAVVDVVDARWPDGMGSPDAEPALFGAWSLGWFGPHVFPGGLARAVSQARRLDPAAVALASNHRAFVRIKSSYVLGQREDAVLRPADHDPAAELRFVTDVAGAVLGAPGALLYFNPNGETLNSASSLQGSLAYHDGEGLLPLPVWANIRILAPETPGWRVMDTVGMDQLGVSDHEACVPGDRFDGGEVESFLRNATAYVFENGPVIQDGDTMDGPGEIHWRARSFDDSIGPPRRRVLRWRPTAGAAPPAVFGFGER